MVPVNIIIRLSPILKKTLKTRYSISSIFSIYSFIYFLINRFKFYYDFFLFFIINA